MTDKQKIKAKVERLKEENSIGLSEYEAGYCNGVGETCEQLLSFINSMPKEPDFGCEANFTTNEELEKEFTRFLDDVEGSPRMWHSDEQMEWALDIARHFAEWQKEQLMKDALNCSIIMHPNDRFANYSISAYVPPLHPASTFISNGDKVKIIIIKED